MFSGPLIPMFLKQRHGMTSSVFYQQATLVSFNHAGDLSLNMIELLTT